MCCFYAIIFFDFYIFVAILLLRSHIAVSGTSAMWELRNLILMPKLPSDVPDEGFFFTRFPPIRISPVGARGKLHTRVCWIG
jgi:hypothetical protein